MPDITSFDITQAAQSYSAIAGILAGFAFAILVWLIERLIDVKDRNPEIESFIRQALIFLGITFFSNVITAVLWALISGETDPNTNRPTVLSFFATLNFALVSPLTIASIIFVLAATQIRRVIPIFRWLFFFGAAVGSFYLWITTTDLLVIQARSDILTVLQENTWWLMAIILVTMVMFLVGYSINRGSIKMIFRWPLEVSFDRFVKTWLLATLLSTVGFGIVAVLEPDRYLPLWLILGANFFWAILMGWAITFLPLESEEKPVSNRAVPSRQ